MNCNSIRRAALALAIALGAVATGCAALHVLVVPTIPQNEVVIKPALNQFMKSVKEPKIVLRVPVPQGQLTQEEQKASEAMNSVYNVIEKELLKSGFTVRDRALLTEVLRDNPKLDYRAIKEKIDTQLILEIVSLTKWDYSNREYTLVKDGTKAMASQPFALFSWRVMAKLILVESGEIGAIFTIHAWPAGWACYYLVQEGASPPYVRFASKEGVLDPRYAEYSARVECPPEMAAPWFVQAMLEAIRKP